MATIVHIVDNVEVLQNSESQDSRVTIVHEQDVWHKQDGDVINIFMKPREYSLAAKCKQLGTPLSSICAINVGIKPYQVGKGRPAQTRKVVEGRIYDSDRCISSEYRRYLRGGDINRYCISPLESRYLKYGPWLAEPRPAANFDASAKIVMRQTGDSLIATIDREQYLCLNNMHVLTAIEAVPSLNYILGVINSRLMNWYYQTLNPEMGEALAEVKKTNVARLPIKIPKRDEIAELSLQDRIVKLVEQMLSLHKQLAAAKTPQEQTILKRQIDATDRQIDQLVYELYGLTEEEIQIVEASGR